MDVETAHLEPASHYERAVAILVGLAAVLAALLAVLQTDAGRDQERANTTASRLSVKIFEGIAVTGLQRTFQLQATQESVMTAIGGTARALASFDQPAASDLGFALSEAQTAAGERLRPIAEEMGEAPDASSGLDPHSSATIALSQEDLGELVEDQNREVDRASDAGQRGDRAVLALSLVAIAAVLLALAAVVGQSSTGRVTLVAAGVTRAFGAGLGVFAFTA